MRASDQTHLNFLYPSKRSERQTFSTVFKSDNERKKERGESNSSPQGNFTLISEKKDVMTSLIDFHLTTQNWVYFPEKKHIIFSSKYFDLDCAFISNRA